MSIMTDDRFYESITLRLRRGVALPIYAVALILSYLSDALGDLGAAIAKD
jgi:hypothetical protein